MLCPKCSNALRISKMRYVKDSEGKLYTEQTLRCVNPKCENYEQVVATIKKEVPVEEE